MVTCGSHLESPSAACAHGFHYASRGDRENPDSPRPLTLPAHSPPVMGSPLPSSGQSLVSVSSRPPASIVGAGPREDCFFTCRPGVRYPRGRVVSRRATWPGRPRRMSRGRPRGSTRGYRRAAAKRQESSGHPPPLAYLRRQLLQHIEGVAPRLSAASLRPRVEPSGPVPTPGVSAPTRLEDLQMQPKGPFALAGRAS
jgi:hypothetical protein